MDEQSDIIKRLDQYLKEQKKALNCSQIKYYLPKKDPYQIEVPESAVKRGEPAEYELKSKKKGWKRYYTPFIVDLLAELETQKKLAEELKKDQLRKLFFKFDQLYHKWDEGLRCLSQLDCLIALAEISSGENYCRPEFVAPDAGVDQCMHIVEGRHPTVEIGLGGDFIANDVHLGALPRESAADSDAMDTGEQDKHIMLLSGPNMGGKSTLLRQTCIITIMAQMGCFVPAEECRLTPVDRIFTRLGASDNILAGQSTFFVELHETATILHEATAQSLVILDELGRGTATFDGTVQHTHTHAHIRSRVHRYYALKCSASMHQSILTLVHSYTRTLVAIRYGDRRGGDQATG
jgi:DNA mismatch repair protein MSH6